MSRLNPELIPNSQGISNVRLSLMSDVERLRYSMIEISMGVGVVGGEHNGLKHPKMGKTKRIACQTCGGDKNCPGHFGHIKLNYPVYSPLHIGYCRKWLNIICHLCGRPFAGKPDCKWKEYKERNSKTKYCSNYGCGAPVRYYTVDKNKCITYKEEGLDYSSKLLSGTAYSILKRVTLETLRDFNVLPKVAPVHTIWNYLLVPPNTLRPESANNEDGQQGNAINKLLTSIMKINDSLIGTNESYGDVKVIKLIDRLNKEITELVKGKSDVPESKKKLIVSYLGKLTGKDGYCREGGTSRRVKNLSRAVICCNPYIDPGSVGVPIYIAMNLCIQVSVTNYNYNQMLMLYNNGSDTYPGCSKIQKKSTGNTYVVDKYKTNLDSKLEYGDILYRHIMDGDYVVMHREPCIDVSTVTAMKAIIIPFGMSFFLNVVSCSFFDADFDGDQMSLQVSIIACIPEFKYLMSAESNFVSREDGLTKIGQHQDSILYSCMLTRDNVSISPNYLSTLFSNMRIGYNTIDKKISGRDIISMLMQKSGYNFTFRASSKFCDSDLSKIKQYPKSETDLIIEHGIVKSGIIDGYVLPGKCKKSINQRIKNLYGSNEAIAFIGRYQKICLNFGLNTMSSTSFRDIHISKQTRQSIKNMIDGITRVASEIMEDYYRGIVKPPPDTEKKEYVELLVKKLLSEIKNVDERDERSSVSVCHDITKLYISEINEFNQMYYDIASGAKGKIDNLKSMLYCVGLLGIDKSIDKYGGRASIYSVKNSIDPRDYGFVPNGYCSGIDPIDESWTANESRKAIVDRALTTAVAGRSSRSTSKSLESILCDYLIRSVDSGKIIQIVYGGDGMDIYYSTKAEVWLFDIKIDNETILARISEGIPSSCKTELKIQHTQMVEHRAKNIDYLISRCRCFDIEWDNKISTCFLIDDIVDNIKQTYTETIGLEDVSDKDLKSSVTLLKEFVDNVASIFYAKEYSGPIHEAHHCAMTNIKAYVYSELNISCIKKKNINNTMLELVFKLMREKLLSCLMDAGTTIGLFTSIAVSHKYTQNIISSHHKLGGVSSTGYDTSKIDEISSVKVKAKIKVPMMNISLVEPHCLTEDSAILVANKMRCFIIKDFMIDRSGYCYGYIGNYAILRDVPYNNMILAHTQVHPPPNDISNKYIRVDLNLVKMQEKNINVDSIIERIEKDGTYHVAYVVDKDSAILFIHLCGKTTINIENAFQISSFLELIERIKISGIDGIDNFKIQKRNKLVNEDGNIKKIDDYYIVTEGSNLYEILLMDEVGIEVTNNFLADEMIEFYGIILSSRHHINLFMGQLGKEIDPKHYHLIADTLSRSGKFMGIGYTGRSKRGDDDIKLITDEKVGKTLSDGPTTYSSSDTKNNISSSIFVSTMMNAGTGSVDARVNLDFILKNRPKYSINSVIDEIVRTFN
jgi:DNA-directed RNA polymerase II subunit RPB1